LFESAVRIKNDVWLIGESRLGENQFTAYRPDSDGVLRRIAPITFLEDGSESHYLVYDALTEYLNLEKDELLFSADKNGALLLDTPKKDLAFTQLSINDFVTYNDLDNALFVKLEEMETLGYYDQLVPEKHPTALYRYALAMKDDLFREQNAIALEAWIKARENYFDGVQDFFLSGTETTIVTGYEELIASEELEDSVKVELAFMRDALIGTFQDCRNAYNDVVEYRNALRLKLNTSFCILGPLGNESEAWGRGVSGNLGETEAAAHFANMLFTGNSITPVDDLQIVFWIFLWVFFFSFFIRNANIIVTVLLGILSAILSIIFFSSVFVYWDLWIHPAIPAASLLFASFVSIMMELIFKRRLALVLRRAYGPYVSSSSLKKIIKRTGPEPWETVISYSAIVAVRSNSVHTAESKDSPVMAALAVRNFRDSISQLFKDAEAVIIGSDGDLVLAAFASPLERSALMNAGIARQYMNNPNDKGKVNPIDKAISSVLAIIKKIDADGWSFGIDCGECAFTYSDASGYSAFGHAVVKARLLSTLTNKYHTKVLISENIQKHAGIAIETRQLDTLVERELGTQESFYALVK
jgi:class 3 adenylate cyclase